jgi:hypothetical protein
LKAKNAIDTMLKEIQRKSGTVTVIGELGAPQIELLKVLLGHAWSKIFITQTHDIQFAELANAIGLDPRDIEGMKSALRALLAISVETHLSGGDFRVNKLLSEAEIRNGAIYYSFPPVIRNQLRCKLPLNRSLGELH